MDALLLSRIQFGFVISFHILFPAFTIGLASWLAFLEFRWLRTREALWRDLYFYWLKIFAISFGMGVVSGIVMSFQFGTKWAVRLGQRAGVADRVRLRVRDRVRRGHLVPVQAGAQRPAAA